MSMQRINLVFVIELDSGVCVEHVLNTPAHTESRHMLDRYINEGVTVSNEINNTLTRYSPNVIRSITTTEVN